MRQVRDAELMRNLAAGHAWPPGAEATCYGKVAMKAFISRSTSASFD